ncbi:MAG: hypothetical protein ABII27_05145 [bacterium]
MQCGSQVNAKVSTTAWSMLGWRAWGANLRRATLELSRNKKRSFTVRWIDLIYVFISL